MINYTLLESQADTLATRFRTAKPFPWIVVDDLVSLEACRQLRDAFDIVLVREQKDPTAAKKHGNVQRKIGVPRLHAMEQCHRDLFEELHSPRFLRIMERITGIAPLYADDDLVGGGLHETHPGGYLNVHTDFNFHPKNQKHRRLNIIVYLNEGWREEWGGHLELWPEDNSACAERVAPVAGRMALFETSETSFHGHPDPLACPEGVTRRSIAAYYYSDWPDGLQQRERTNYRLTPKQRGELAGLILARRKAGADRLATLDELSTTFQRPDVKSVLQEVWPPEAPAKPLWKKIFGG